MGLWALNFNVRLVEVYLVVRERRGRQAHGVADGQRHLPFAALRGKGGTSQSMNNRALAITSRKHVTKNFRMAKKYCPQWQLNGSQSLTHDLCAIFTGSTQRDNCAIVIVNIIET